MNHKTAKLLNWAAKALGTPKGYMRKCYKEALKAGKHHQFLDALRKRKEQMEQLEQIQNDSRSRRYRTPDIGETLRRSESERGEKRGSTVGGIKPH